MKNFSSSIKERFLRRGQYPLTFLNILICSLITGIYTAQSLTLPYEYLFLLLIVNFLTALYMTLKQYRWTFIAFIALFALLGFTRSQSALELPFDNISRFDEQAVTVEGTITQEPRFRQDAEGIWHITYITAVNKAIANNKAEPASGSIYLYVKSKDKNQAAQIGDTVSASGKLRLIHGYQNPSQIDRSLAARRQGIYAALSAGKKPIVILKHDDSFSLQKFSSEIRQSLLSSLQKAMPPQEAGLIFAILFGGYSDIAPELLEAFTITGIVHILSVSGSHISLLAGFILNTGRALRLPRRLNLMILFLVIAFYVLLCGCVPPVLRAAAMGLLSAAAMSLNKNAEACHLLSITALVMLLADPLLLFSVSFQLSFASTAGLVYIMPRLKKLLAFMPHFIADNAALTLSAQLAVLPLTAWYFNSLSPASVLANLIAVPPLEFIIILGLLASLVGIVFPFAEHLIFITASLALGAASDITVAISKLPLASIYIPTLPFCAVICYYLTLLVLLRDKLRRAAVKSLYRFKYFALLILLPLTAFTICQINKPGMMQVHFIDVGQGDAALIISPTGRAAMVDTGGAVNSDFDVGKRVDLPYLRHYGVTSLDYLILSHKDADHAAGAAAILKTIPVRHLIISAEDKLDYAKILHISPDSQILRNAITARRGLTFRLDEAEFKVIRSGNSEDTGNEASNVIKLTYHNFSVLFTGDITKEIERQLSAEAAEELPATVLKTAHHGSKTSSDAVFLRAVQPRYALISAGRYNSFGHPHDEVLDRLNALPAAVLRTDQLGAVVFTTDGYKMTIDTFNKDEKGFS